MSLGSTEVSEAAEHVGALSRAYQQILGKDPVLYRKNAYCDTLRFSHSGIPSITFGPGEDGWPPVNEFIDIEKVVAATKIYALFFAGLLQGGGNLILTIKSILRDKAVRGRMPASRPKDGRSRVCAVALPK